MIRASFQKPGNPNMKAKASIRVQAVIPPLLFLAATGCSPSHRATPAFVARDSAGIRIWEHGDLSSSSAALWAAADAPVLVLGEEEAEEPFLFSRIRRTLPMPQGGVAVADGLSNEIRFFDGDGNHLRSAGGEGTGPGEFTRLRSAFAYPGDSIAATNAMGGTISVFSSGGEWGRATACEPASALLSGLFVEGALEGGAFLARAMKQFPTEAPTEGYHREPSVFQLCSPEGAAGPTLAEFPDVELETLSQDGRWMSFPLEMGRRATSVIVGNEVLVGVTDRLELWRFGADGEMRGILRVGISPRPLDEETKEQWIEHALDGVDDPETARQTRRRYRDRAWPDSLPVFSDLKGDSEGNLWVRQFSPEYVTGPSDWWVFSPDGSFLARATLPDGLRVEAIGSDFVLGVAADDLGVERVYRYALEKK